jgi:hypothetical protein
MMGIAKFSRAWFAAGFVFVCAGNGWAQPCGSGIKSNDIFQINDWDRVEAYIQTATNVAESCHFIARAEGYIDGFTAAAHQIKGTAHVYRSAQMAYGMNAESFGHHFLINSDTNQWFDLAPSHDETAVRAPDITTQYGCELMGGTWLETYNGCEMPGSPIVLDMSHTGIRLTSVRNGVLFDLNSDGTPEQIAWTRVDSDDAWLAMDRNSNGMIDNGAELFGNFTPAYPTPDESGHKPNAANGFEALRFLENPLHYGASRADERLDAADAAFARLLIWTDRNHNGISEPEELQSAAAAGVLSVSLNYKESKREDRHGNQFRQKGRATFLRNGQVVTDAVWDVWLVGTLSDDEDEPATP